MMQGLPSLLPLCSPLSRESHEAPTDPGAPESMRGTTTDTETVLAQIGVGGGCLPAL